MTKPVQKQTQIPQHNEQTANVKDEMCSVKLE